MNKPIYDNYWQNKEKRKKLKEENPDKKQSFKHIMAMLFSRDKPEEEKDTKHKRSPKERRMRRARHQAMMRNHV